MNTFVKAQSGTHYVFQRYLMNTHNAVTQETSSAQRGGNAFPDLLWTQVYMYQVLDSPAMG